MSEEFTALFSRAREWFEQAGGDGWLEAADRARLARVESATPADLFSETHARPLVVAFFGGTGVGKSSLLNRLAGATIARTGVERPTSREVTVYVHESVQLAELPSELPLESVRIERHDADPRRSVVWIDAPDIDSAEEANRQCALAWLPHVDLLIYVVSPERYRDDVGWRVLRERGQKHGWIFVMNRWDEGDVSQRDDFARMLRQAGFGRPVLLCTCCTDFAGRLPSEDQFAEIEAAIGELLAAHGLRELTRLGHRARLLELRGAVVAAAQRSGTEDSWEELELAWQTHWLRARAAIVQGADWSMRAAAARLAVREAGLLAQVARQMAARGSKNAARSEQSTGADGDLEFLTKSLWDDWAQSKLDAGLDATEVDFRRAAVAAKPVRSRLEAHTRAAGSAIRRHVQDQVRAALATPSGAAARALRRVTGFLTAALPAVALSAVAYFLVTNYFAGEFLGTDFAISSALLVLVAWALPFSLDRLLRPSLERTALRAMRRSFAEGLDGVGAKLGEALADASRQAEERREEATQIVAALSTAVLRPLQTQNDALARVVAAPLAETVDA